MSKKLVAYFSASGVTRRAAERIAKKIEADIYEIKPLETYTIEDLDWRNNNSRSSLEMNDKGSRPELADDELDISLYDEIWVGFPIWWYTAPHIILTFLEKYDFSGKTVQPFATSGGSGYGNTNDDLKKSARGAKLLRGKMVREVR